MPAPEQVETGEATADQNAPTGTIADVTTATLIEATTAVPGRLRLGFGLRYEVVGTPPGAQVGLSGSCERYHGNS